MLKFNSPQSSLANLRVIARNFLCFLGFFYYLCQNFKNYDHRERQNLQHGLRGRAA